jgi:RNA polymerase sigma factor (sigma-70 family)
MVTVDENDWLAQRFEENRGHLRAVAYRMLGSAAEADDAVQESWLHVSRAYSSDVRNVGGWLTTVVARVCLDMLRSRRSRREEPLGVRLPEEVVAASDAPDPEREAVLADSVGLALLVVLDTLAPPERLAFVLHDMFVVPFEEIAEIVGRSPAAARQLASRARRRVRGGSAVADADLARQREVVDAFLAAARGGDFDALVALLDPDVVLRADARTVSAGAEAEVIGARGVATTFSGRARAAELALVDGAPGLVFAMNGKPRVVFDFTVVAGRIVEIALISEPASLLEIDLAVL